MLRLLATVALLCGAATAAPLVLAEGGQPRATIVLPDDAAPAERTSATELAAYLTKITGAQFTGTAGPGRLLVGPSRAARAVLGDALVDGLGPEEFVIRTVGGDLLLVGGRPRGTLYAVYSFLADDLGCRWLTWYDDEDGPRRPTLALPATDRRGAPAFAVRDIVTHTNGDSDRQAMQRFLVRNRCQGPDLRFTGDLAAYGGTSHRYAFPPDGWLVHTLFQWVPPKVHFAAHPEWFSLAGDKRVASRQLCFTSRGLRQAMTAAILKRIAEADPGGTYSVSAMDWPGAMCDCADCRALVQREGTPGAPLFDYLAEAGRAVQERFPQARLSTLAYRKEQSEAPPATTKLPDNVIVIFAPIDDNFAAPIEHASNATTLRNLERWPQATRHLWVWYYPNTYGPALPLGNLSRLAKDLRLFKRVGVEGCFMEHDAPGVYDSRRTADLQTWLIARLMWDPDRDLAALVADYTDRHYGPAAPAVRRYLAALEDATAALPARLTWNASTGQHRHLTPEFMASCQRLLDEAEAAASADERLLRRVRQLRMSLDLACLLRPGRADAAWSSQRQQSLARYRDTYTRTVNTRNLPARRERLLAGLTESLRWFSARTLLKPLPAPLAAVPAERVRQFTPESFQKHSREIAIVEDPLAAGGFAAAMPPSLTAPPYAPAGLPKNALNFGYYDAAAKRQQNAFAGRDEPLSTGAYRFYPIGRTTLSADCCVWFDWTWNLQLPEIAGLFDPQEPGRQWEIYVSVRFEGPAYDPQSAIKQNRFYVDRVVLVAVPR